jgi:hypothetical protein
VYKTTIQNLVLKNLFPVLVIGNNMLTGQNSAIAESVNKKEVMQTLVNATKALKKIFNPQEKKCISLLTKIFVKRKSKF